jgi:glucosamine--fructose-6-phosphate aminotransferase (isomerizing)
VAGVIAYAGVGGARRQLVAGLARLGRGGCDSAGICTLGDHGLELVHSFGHLEHLRRRINGHGITATAGIASAARVRAPQPRVVGDVAIAVDGDLDGEAVARVVARAYRGSLAAAVQAAYTQLDGRFAFVALHRQVPETIAGACRGVALLAGTGHGETFLATTAAAFDGPRVTPLRDGEIVVGTAAGLWVAA